MHSNGSLIFADVGAADDPLFELGTLTQALYLRCYLEDLNAKSVIIEPHYFDRDYLSEFAAFYCTSTAGYPNVCRRTHYFSIHVDRDTFVRACSGDDACRTQIAENYLGFVVLRPIPGAPLGRSVLRWYPQDADRLPRVVTPSRRYLVHIAGLEWAVEGLAWQQQDAGVGACATVALWSMLHSSAFDDRHVIPTTAEVTQVAHRAGLSGYRIFPNRGLNFAQLLATIRDSGFAPLVIPGDLKGAGPESFSREHFSASLASLVRSGFPVLITGKYVDSNGNALGLHAVCAVGFRQAASTVNRGAIGLEDAATEYVYVHDDNLGPAGRFRIIDQTAAVGLRAERPQALHNRIISDDPSATHPVFTPTAMIAAAHDDVRMSPDELHRKALRVGAWVNAAAGQRLGLSLGVRFMRLAKYIGEELEQVLRGRPAGLGTARLQLWEEVPPMSLHIGVIRIGSGPTPLVDVLVDTTDSDRNARAFCHVAYHPVVATLISRLIAVEPNAQRVFGKSVRAY